jgi:glucokinase
VKRWRIGVDVGGTKIAAGLVCPAGQIHEQLSAPTPATEGPTAILNDIARAVETLRAKTAPGDVVTGVGIGTGGVVDHRSGVIVSATGLLSHWAGTRVAGRLQKRLGLPVSVDNDVNAMALGEHRFGVGRGLTDVLYVAIGTGIGGALVLAGELRRGAHDTAGELGHLPTPDGDQRPCSCGGHGHLESVASGPAITERYRRRSGRHDVQDLQTVVARAAAGDSDARAVITEAATVLGRMLAGLANTVDPEAIVIGGGVAQVGAALWTPMDDTFRSETLPALEKLPLLAAALGPAAAIAGAATLISDTA